MSSPPNSLSQSGSRAHLQGSVSQSLFSLNASTSRPFLNMLNPMGRNYQGYIQANQSVLEEEEEDEDNDIHNLESGILNRNNRFTSGKPSPKRRAGASNSKSSNSRGWRGDVSKMNILRPNIQDHDKNQNQDSSDDEVPQSFMIEAASPSQRRPTNNGKLNDTLRQPLGNKGRNAPPILPSASKDNTKIFVPPRPSELNLPSEHTSDRTNHDPPKYLRGLDAYERALWNWVNVYNLDAFLQEVYYYYEGKGIYCIALSRGLNLLTVGFVIGFSTFLLGCVDYSRIRSETVPRLSDVVVDKCVTKFSGFTLLFFLLFAAFYIWQLFTFILGIRRLVDMYQFYTHLLRIPDADIQTISWPEIVRRIGAIREENPLTALSSRSTSDTATATAKLDAHDVANRIMRQENYLIALFNKELLDLRVPLPTSLRRFVPPEEGKGRMLTKALEWNLRFCLMEYLFDRSGRVRKVFLKSKNRTALVEGLRRRLVFMGILNAIFAPFIVLYLIMYSFFRYFEEYHKNPSSIGGRKYTPFSQWKFREFNELPHLFIRRLDESYPAASMYIGQFPNEKLTILMRFVAFIAGSFAAVLVLASVVDPDLIVHFEITPHRTVLFYLTVFGSILAVARGMIPEENRVFDPELLMMEVIQHTHYMPDSWKNQLHAKKVHQEFGELFAMKIIVYTQELLSVVLTPFVLWLSLPACAPSIIDFFREFTVHVDSLGYVCSFAVFDFQRHGNIKFGAPTAVNDERLMSKEGKMEKSFLNFKAAHPEWIPRDPSGSLYLSRMADYNAIHPSPLARRRYPTSGIAGGADHDTMTGTVVGRPDPADRSMDYDRALRASQMVRSRLQSHGPPGSSSMYQSGVGGMSMAQTAVLGDSQWSAGGLGRVPEIGSPLAGTTDTPPAAVPAGTKAELGADGGVESELGESYVDGVVKRPKSFGISQSQQEEEEELEDGGVLGLLAQIYGRKGHRPGI